MSGLVYRRIIKHQWVKAGDQASQAEQDAVLAKLDQALREVGGKRMVLLHYDSAADALQEWGTLGTETFPDLQAAKDYEDRLRELGCDDYLEMTVKTGTSRDFEHWLNPPSATTGSD